MESRCPSLLSCVGQDCIHAYRRTRKPKKQGASKVLYENLLKNIYPTHPNHIWAGDFTYIWFQGRFLYLATIIDLFTREIVGIALSDRHDSSLVLESLWEALRNRSHPEIFHSDNGREYDAKVFKQSLIELDIKISRSRKGAPWENGYQESFYGKFKIDLGDPSRFKTKGELVYAIHRQIYYYNTKRIHSAFNMPPRLFAYRHLKLLQSLSTYLGS